jgi:hypothetical protein
MSIAWMRFCAVTDENRAQVVKQDERYRWLVDIRDAQMRPRGACIYEFEWKRCG